MRAFLVAIVLTLLLGTAASYVFQGFQRPVESEFATQGVRLDPHGGERGG